MNRHRRLVAALLLGAGSTFVLGPAAVATPGSTVHEAVVSTLAPNGDVLSTRISQLIQLESRSGEEVTLQVPRVRDLVSYRNLTGFTNPSGEDGDFVWRTSGKLEAAALAKTTQSLPVRVRLTYLLDGKEVDPDEIKGADGDVRIRVELENVSGNPKTLEYEGVTSPVLTSTVNQYVPVEYLVRAEFPTDRWSGVGGPDVHVSPGGVEMVVASAAGFIFPPATSTRATVEFEATSDNVLLPRIQVFANAHASQEYLDALQAQFEALQALYGGLGGLGDTLTKIYDGTVALAGGAEEIIGGVGERDEKTGKPVVELGKDGLPTTLLGTIGFLEQAIRGDVLGGIGERDKTTGEGVVVKDDKGHTTTLIGGLQSQKDTYDDKLIPAIQEALVGLDDFISQVSSGGGQLVGGAEQIRDGLSGLLAALQSNDPLNSGFREGLVAIDAGVTQLITTLDVSFGQSLTSIVGQTQLLLGTPLDLDQFTAVATIKQTAELLLAALGKASDPPTDTTVIGGLLLIGAGTELLLAGLGNADEPATDTTVIGGIKLLKEGSDLLVAGTGDLVEGVLGGLGQVKAGFTNPEFTKSQPSLDGKTPKEYFQECPACFDPTSPVFDPATAHPDFQPSLLEVFTLFSEGIRDALPKLQSFDAKNPGLVDGLQQIADGLAKLAAALHTFDPDDPGLVDGLNLVRSGLQQVGQGLFATNELGVRTTRGQVGDQGDTVGRWQGALSAGGEDASSTGALGQKADAVATTYVFDLAAQSTGTRDNTVRGALMALTAAGLAVLWRRPRFRT